jgi:RNA polymerase sigma factor (sigma-70 family)
MSPTVPRGRTLGRVMEQALTFEGRDTVRSDDRTWTETVGRLFDTHHARLYALALRLTWGADEARDLVQDCFLRALARGRVPGDDDAAERWLVRILVNLCKDRSRKAAVRRAHTAPPREETTGDPAVDVAVRDAVLALPVRQRAVVVLHEIEGRTLEEIAGLLGIAAVTARWHLHAARKRLREEFSS